jgi:excisionase family DNA binding protein
MSNERSPEFFTTRQAAHYLAVHPNTIRNLMLRGELHAERIGARIIRLRKADVQALLTPYRGGEYGIWASNSSNHSSDSGSVL